MGPLTVWSCVTAPWPDEEADEALLRELALLEEGTEEDRNIATDVHSAQR